MHYAGIAIAAVRLRPNALSKSSTLDYNDQLLAGTIISSANKETVPNGSKHPHEFLSQEMTIPANHALRVNHYSVAVDDTLSAFSINFIKSLTDRYNVSCATEHRKTSF